MYRKFSPKARSAAVLTLMLAALLLGLTVSTGCDVLDATKAMFKPVTGLDASVAAKGIQRSGINMHGWYYGCWYWYFC